MGFPRHGVNDGSSDFRAPPLRRANQPMKVLMVTTSYPRDSSDQSGIFVERLTHALAALGVASLVLAPGDRRARREDRAGSIRVVRFSYAPPFLMRLAYGAGGILENLRRSPALALLLPFFLCAMSLRLLRLARTCDLIHAHWLVSGLAALPAKWILGKRLVVTLRGSDMLPGFRQLLGLATVWADAFTTVNQKWAQQLTAVPGVEVSYIPNGVLRAPVVKAPGRIARRAAWGIEEGQTVVLFVGALRRVKGVDVLAQAARLVLARNKRILFLVIGPGRPADFGLQHLPNVRCVGRLAPGAVLMLYQACDVFVLPSRAEGRPNALLEAMAAGLPVVATRLPGVEEVVTPESGILVDQEDPVALSQAVEFLVTRPERRQSMGRCASERIDALRLDWETSARRYRGLYAQVLGCAG